MTKNEIITCPKCGNEIGKIIEIGGVELLDTGTGYARHYNGLCKICEHEIYFTVDGRTLERILQKLSAIGK